MLLLQSVAIIAAFVATTEGALNCPTKSGKPCVLPFSYGGKKTTECLATGSQYWCATDVKADLTMSSPASWDYCLKDKCEDDSASTSQASTVNCDCPAIPACPVCPACPACNCPACNIYNTCPVTGGGSQPLIAVSATMSSTYESTYENYMAKNCIDGVLTGGTSNLCHTNPEKAPWLAIDFGAQVLVEKVVIHNRDDCCGERLKNAEVRVADQLPTSAQDMFSGGQLLATFKGPAKTGEVVTLTSTGHVGRFVIVQLDQSPGIANLNLHEVTVWGRKQASPAVQGSGHL